MTNVSRARIESIEWHRNHADELAQKVVSTSVDTLPARMIDDFQPLLQAAWRFRYAQREAENRRELNILTDLDVAEEKATRQAFAEAHKAFEEKHGRL